MKRKNTEASVGVLLATALLIVVVLLLAGAVLAEALQGKLRFPDPDRSLPGQLLSWGLLAAGAGAGIKAVSASLWLWWTQLRNAVTGAWKKPLTALALLGLIASAPFWLFPIRIEADETGTWMLLYALYLLFAGLITIVPCSLIYGLCVSVGERESEKEELDEAKKY